MVFSSIIFLFMFLPLTLVLYFLTGKRFRNLMLLCASLGFYAWGEGFFVLAMFASILVNYVTGLLIERFRGQRVSRVVLFAAIGLNLGMLGAFKYANFIVLNLNDLFLALHLGPVLLAPVHLPIGISFFTFQAMSYIVDVYRKQGPAQKNPINIGLYISLFPQLIAGPIVRYHDIARQIVSRTFRRSDFAEGVERFILGLGKKVLIANPMAVVADQIFLLAAEDLTAGTAWLGILCYSLQIYFDFSGYSDMAIGLGRMFGFHFLENFNYPYISQSIREFWRRWHISLSTWFRDYLYISLGGNRRGPLRTYVNLISVFFLCGLWHGASWNFVIWGLLHGAFMVLERLGVMRGLQRLWRPLRHLYSLFVVTVCWVFFRAETLPKAAGYLSAMFGLAKGAGVEHAAARYLDQEVLVVLVAGILFSTPVPAFLRRLRQNLSREHGWISSDLATALSSVSNVMVLCVLLYASVMSLSAGAYNPFIYFRF